MPKCIVPGCTTNVLDGRCARCEENKVVAILDARTAQTRIDKHTEVLRDLVTRVAVLEAINAAERAMLKRLIDELQA